MAEFKVVSAVKTGSYDSQYGEEVDGKKVMFKYAVELEGQSDAVELSQKPSTDAPKAGDVLNGSIETTQYGKRFKKESKGGFPGGGGRAGGGAPESTRQTALKAAADVYQGSGVVAEEVLKHADKFHQWLETGNAIDKTFPGAEVIEPSPEELAKSDANADQLDV